jgi:anaerobic selenocysteine-containing dehydrogenase
MFSWGHFYVTLNQPAQRRVQGEQAVTMHPHDAAERGITDGQGVRVYNDRG